MTRKLQNLSTNQSTIHYQAFYFLACSFMVLFHWQRNKNVTKVYEIVRDAFNFSGNVSVHLNIASTMHVMEEIILQSRCTCYAFITFLDQFRKSRISRCQQNTSFKSCFCSLVLFKFDTSSPVRDLQKSVFFFGREHISIFWAMKWVKIQAHKSP